MDMPLYLDDHLFLPLCVRSNGKFVSVAIIELSFLQHAHFHLVATLLNGTLMDMESKGFNCVLLVSLQK